MCGQGPGRPLRRDRGGGQGAHRRHGQALCGRPRRQGRSDLRRLRDRPGGAAGQGQQRLLRQQEEPRRVPPVLLRLGALRHAPIRRPRRQQGALRGPVARQTDGLYVLRRHVQKQCHVRGLRRRAGVGGRLRGVQWRKAGVRHLRRRLQNETGGSQGQDQGQDQSAGEAGPEAGQNRRKQV